MLGAPTTRHIPREHYTPSGCDHWLSVDTLGTLKNSLYFFSNFRTDWEADTSQKMKIKMSALIVKLDLQQTRLAKTFQWSKREPLNPSQFRSSYRAQVPPSGTPQVSLCPWGTGWELFWRAEPSRHGASEARLLALFVPTIPWSNTSRLTGLQSSL